MTPEPTPLVTVLPCDREAAADRLQGGRSAINEYEAHTIERVRDGRFDGHAWVQAFARHRLAALEEAAKFAEQFADEIGEPAFAIADGIRALSNKTGEESGDDAACTSCNDTGWNFQTERHCACGAVPSSAYEG